MLLLLWNIPEQVYEMIFLFGDIYSLFEMGILKDNNHSKK